LVRIAGEGASDWQVVDMGSIMVHLFLAEAREHYDLETLWSSAEKSV
jgi:ribosomal silencing factor RsfS